MWTKLDDGLFDHSKIILAGDIIGGPHGVATALGTFTAGILYANKHTTDGFLPGHVVAHWPHSRKPAQLTAALVAAGLWDVVEGGWQIHDYHDYQLSKEEVAQRRDMRREAGRLGGQRSGVVRRNNTPVIPKQNASAVSKQNEASCLGLASTVLNPVPSRPVKKEEDPAAGAAVPFPARSAGDLAVVANSYDPGAIEAALHRLKPVTGPALPRRN